MTRFPQAHGVVSQGGVSGQVLFDTPGEHTWTVPNGVTSVCVVCIGGGGGAPRYAFRPTGGGGGGLGWSNSLPVTPGATVTIRVGAGGLGSSAGATAGGESNFEYDGAVYVRGYGGGAGSKGASNTAWVAGGAGGSRVGQGGGVGGRGGNIYSSASYAAATGGGGAGGYAGAGGNGRNTTQGDGTAGAGGAGGGGATSQHIGNMYARIGGGGGGVGARGQGSNGAGGVHGGTYHGQGGSDGEAGKWVSQPANTSPVMNQSMPLGGLYGGGGGANDAFYGSLDHPSGAGGAVRIMWGSGRAYPSTLTQDL